mmetsp:Transcript_2584/g.5894  ORF Transcript_2584/g.5894 Transcript_2584/m.5894 type:complete len:261 (+) Transcript_2584:564-1346(+)
MRLGILIFEKGSSWERYRIPASRPHNEGQHADGYSENINCKPNRYLNVLSLTGIKKIPPLAEGGISEKKKVKSPNMIEKGPGAIRLVMFSARSATSNIIERIIITSTATENFAVLNLRSNSRKVYKSIRPKKIPDGVVKTNWLVISRQSSSLLKILLTSRRAISGLLITNTVMDATNEIRQRHFETGALPNPGAMLALALAGAVCSRSPPLFLSSFSAQGNRSAGEQTAGGGRRAGGGGEMEGEVREGREGRRGRGGKSG